MTKLFSSIHHVAIIGSDYQRSKQFYTEILGLEIIREVYRAERQSYKLDLKISDSSHLEIFSFPSPPPRVSRPEACGLRHLALGTTDLKMATSELKSRGVLLEDVRKDDETGRLFVFFSDPDGLPIELYEI